MRFGYFLLYNSPEPSQDSRRMDEALQVATLAEELSYDTLWFGEHHFNGDTVYADPIVFAAAVASRTERVRLGFAVVQTGLHHPVRLAIQTSVLDNLSHGRLMVGVARGTSGNDYEYRGFGTTAEIAADQNDEAEELLVKAWTQENIDHHGRYWDVSMPGIRPRPIQKPHPPLYRACLTRDSISEMGRLGRPVLIRSRTAVDAREKIGLYADSMRGAGFDNDAVERSLDQLWDWRDCYLAETDNEALEEFLPAEQKRRERVVESRRRWNSPDTPVASPPAMLPASSYGEAPDPAAPELFVGSPGRVREQMTQLREAGVRNLMLTHYGVLPPEHAARSMRMCSEQVMAHFM